MFKLDSTLAKDSHLIGSLSLSLLLLINDSQYPWFILVPQREDIKEIYQLSDDDQKQLWKESRLVSVAVMDIFKGDKLNLAAIGNMVPQLHLHHVVRYKTDPGWPAPVWGQLPMVSYQHPEVESIIKKVACKLACSGLVRV